MLKFHEKVFQNPHFLEVWAEELLRLHHFQNLRIGQENHQKVKKFQEFHKSVMLVKYGLWTDPPFKIISSQKVNSFHRSKNFRLVLFAPQTKNQAR